MLLLLLLLLLLHAALLQTVYLGVDIQARESMSVAFTSFPDALLNVVGTEGTGSRASRSNLRNIKMFKFTTTF
jgi:hypothetical protein